MIKKMMNEDIEENKRLYQEEKEIKKRNKEKGEKKKKKGEIELVKNEENYDMNSYRNNNANNMKAKEEIKPRYKYAGGNNKRFEFDKKEKEEIITGQKDYNEDINVEEIKKKFLGKKKAKPDN